jgi:hypothetical protein
MAPIAGMQPCAIVRRNSSNQATSSPIAPRSHEAHLVMVGNEMDTHGIGQAQVDNEEGSRPALPTIISHRLSGLALFAGGS